MCSRIPWRFFSCHCSVYPPHTHTPLICDQPEYLMCFCETVITITLGCRSWGWPSSTCAMPPAQCLESSAARKPTLRTWPSEGEKRGATLLWLHVNRCSSGMSERERRWDCEVDITAAEQRSGKHLPSPVGSRFQPATHSLVQVLILQGLKHEVTFLCPSPDGIHIAVGYEDGAVRIFSLLNGESNVSFNGHKSAVSVIRYDKLGARLVTGSKVSQGGFLMIFVEGIFTLFQNCTQGRSVKCYNQRKIKWVEGILYSCPDLIKSVKFQSGFRAAGLVPICHSMCYICYCIFLLPLGHRCDRVGHHQWVWVVPTQRSQRRHHWGLVP